MLAVRELKLLQIRVIALILQEFEMHIAHERRAGDKYERVYKDMLKVNAFVARSGWES